MNTNGRNNLRLRNELKQQFKVSPDLHPLSLFIHFDNMSSYIHIPRICGSINIAAKFSSNMLPLDPGDGPKHPAASHSNPPGVLHPGLNLTHSWNYGTGCNHFARSLLSRKWSLTTIQYSFDISKEVPTYPTPLYYPSLPYSPAFAPVQCAPRPAAHQAS